jgi:hypothetical protein
MLPRIPVPIERDMKAKMAAHDEANKHLDVPEPEPPGYGAHVQPSLSITAFIVVAWCPHC